MCVCDYLLFFYHLIIIVTVGVLLLLCLLLFLLLYDDCTGLVLTITVLTEMFVTILELSIFCLTSLHVYNDQNL